MILRMSWIPIRDIMLGKSNMNIFIVSDKVFVKLQSKSIPVQVKWTRSWLCFPPVTTRTTRTRTTLTKIYQNEVYYRLGIWNINFSHKIKTSTTIPRMVTHHPKDGHLPSQGRSPTIPSKGTHNTQDGKIPLPDWSSTILRMASHQPRMVTNYSKGPRMVTHHPSDGKPTSHHL